MSWASSGRDDAVTQSGREELVSGSIFLVQEGSTLVEMTERPYDSEAVLQELLARYPDLLAGAQVDPAEPRRWLLVTREAGVPDHAGGPGRWSIDHLFLDQDGVPTLVEVKRGSDTRLRREVVGQMLDYAANVVLHWPVGTIQQMLAARCASERLLEEQEIRRLIAADGADPADYWVRVKTNLDARRLRLVFVADVIPLELQRVVEFLNDQMNQTQVLALEVKQYAAADGPRTLVPRVIGQTAAAQQAKAASSVPQRTWDEASFYADLTRRAGDQAAHVAHRLQAWATGQGFTVLWGRGSQDGAMIPVLDTPTARHFLFTVWTYGRLEVDFEYMGAEPFAQPDMRAALRDRLHEVPGVSIPDAALTKRPSIRLDALAGGDALGRLTAAFDWFVGQVPGGR